MKRCSCRGCLRLTDALSLSHTRQSAARPDRDEGGTVVRSYPCARSAKGGLDGAFQWKNHETTIRNYFAARRHLCLGRYDGLQGNLPLLPTPFSKEELSRSPSITTSQVLQIFRWLIATINDVSNVQPSFNFASSSHRAFLA